MGMRRRQVDERRLSDPGSSYKRADYNVRQPKEAWVLIPDVAPPLVDQALFDICQERLKQNPNNRSGNPEYRYLFTGLLRCPICKRRLYGCRSRKGGKLYLSYRCRDYAGSARADGVICNPRHYKENWLRECVEAVILVEPDLLSAAYTAYLHRQGDGDANNEYKRIDEQLAELMEKERATAEAEIAALSAGRDVGVYRRILASIDEQRRHLIERQSALDVQSEQITLIDVPASSAIIAESLEQLKSVLAADKITTAEKNGLLGRVIQRIEPGEDVVEVFLHPLKEGATVTQVVTRLS